MVLKCSIFGCSNRKDRESDLEYYRIPAILTNQGKDCEDLSTRRRREWLAKIGQDFTNKNLQNVRVCSAHFINGKKAALYDPLNPDWVPTVNLGRLGNTAKPNRYIRLQNRKRKEPECPDLCEDSHLRCEADLILEDETSEREDGVGTQTDVDNKLMGAMESELQALRSENCALKAKVLSFESKYSLDFFKDNNEKVKHLTGLPSFSTLLILFQFLEPHLPNSLVLNKFKTLVLTVIKLRLNLTNVFLSYEFDIAQPTVSRLFTNTIAVMYAKLKKLIKWPDRDTLRKTMPMEFRKHFGNRCAVIIDCFEVFTEKPSSLEPRAETWSSYKHNNTLKYLIGITPQGSVSFISNGWGGRVSDKYITEHCGFLNKLLPNDLVLADRGFDVRDSVGSVCAEVRIPAFTRGRDQLSAVDVETTRKLAHCRIHVERVIGVVRQKYTILNSRLPVNFLMNKDQSGMSVMDKIVCICCVMVNLCGSVVDFD